MYYIRRVKGHSMMPTLQPGWIVIFRRTNKFEIGDIVLARIKKTDYVKRVMVVKKKKIELAGDNHADSHSPKNVTKKDIIGRLVWPR